ncbi:MAG TPA: hypothetical protein VHC22_27985 [Pirellulales bacterium]|nr:hypothetical protein [Pirellulales bacterium]
MNDQPDELALIDRLATGELDEPSRRRLLAWLDREPLHWRRCALALLEAREIEQAFAAWQGESPRPKPLRPIQERRPSSRAILALAASILVAFCLGLFTRGLSVAPAPSVVEVPHPSSQQTPAEPTQNERPSDEVQPHSTVAHQTVAAAPSPVPAGPIPPYVRSQWERRGYQLISHPARLPVVLPDGRRVTVPVDQLQLNYVGQRTY